MNSTTRAESPDDNQYELIQYDNRSQSAPADCREISRSPHDLLKNYRPRGFSFSVPPTLSSEESATAKVTVVFGDGVQASKHFSFKSPGHCSATLADRNWIISPNLGTTVEVYISTGEKTGKKVGQFQVTKHESSVIIYRGNLGIIRITDHVASNGR